MRKIVASVAAVVLIATGCETPPPTIDGGPCPLFPANSFWHAKVDNLNVHPRSNDWVNSIGANSWVHPDFGSGLWEGRPIGFPFTTADATTPRVPVSFTYPHESDTGPYPLPYDAPVEGGQNGTGDRHVIVINEETCELNELFNARRGDDPNDGWTAGSGARWDLNSNDLRPDSWTSADAAGLAMLPGLVRYEEIEAGVINHPIRMTAPFTQKAYQWPARHFASNLTDPKLPPMGAWFRLRADVDISTLPEQARIVAQAMKTHGVILADNGASWYLSGTPDERFDNQQLLKLRTLTGSDFEAVDTAPLMVSPHSGEAAAI